MSEVLVVIGVGRMGKTIARRLAPGRSVVLADFNEEAIVKIAEEMTVEGFDVATQKVDISSRESVKSLADFAAEQGAVRTVIHTAGLSPAQAAIEAILQVDLVGTAFVLEEFERVVAAGAAGVVISSSSGYLSPDFAREQQAQIRTLPPKNCRSWTSLLLRCSATPAWHTANQNVQTKFKCKKPAQPGVRWAHASTVLARA